MNNKLITDNYVVTYNGQTTTYSKFTWNFAWFLVYIMGFLTGFIWVFVL